MRRAAWLLLVSLGWIVVAFASHGVASALADCGDGTFDGGESCDDGNTVSGDGCAATCSLEPSDYYKCYKVKSANPAARGRLDLADRFGTGEAEVRRPVMFCTPVDVNGDGIGDRATHFTCYASAPAPSPVDRKTRTVLIGNAFGGNIVAARNARLLCVPSVVESGLLPLLLPCGNGTVDAGEECDDGNTEDGDGCSGGCRDEPTQRFTCYRAKAARRSPRFVRRELALADGFEATTMKAVRVTRLCAPVDVAGQGVKDEAAFLECFKLKAEAGKSRAVGKDVVVRNRFGTERLKVRGPRAVCLPSGKAVSLPIPQVDSVKCYTAAEAKGTAKFTKRTVDLSDRFETKETKVKTPEMICNAVDVGGSGILDATTHLTCYDIDDTGGQPKFAARDVVVNNVFGTLTITVKKASSLCVPAEIPPVTSAVPSNRYKCYSAESKKGSPEEKLGRVDLADEFETKRTVIEEPMLFCTPVDEDGQGTVNENATLTCFEVKDARRQPAFTQRDVQTEDEFGGLTLSVSGTNVLCVPSVTIFEAQSTSRTSNR